jgi:hypothetical protein
MGIQRKARSLVRRSAKEANMARLRMLGAAVVGILLCGTALAADMKIGTLSGHLQTKSGTDLSNAMVFLFNDKVGPPPAPGKYWRVPDEIVETDAQGRFVAKVPFGTYYLGAIKRLEGNDVGPPRQGDLFLHSVDTKGNAKKYKVTVSRHDVGTIAAARTFTPDLAVIREGISAIEGVVITGEGQPMVGASVFAFNSPAMVGKPVFVSDRTGKDGSFQLRVSGGGTYYLKAREEYGGGPPKVGTMMGNYGEATPIPVMVKNGEIVKGISLKVNRFAGKGGATR